MKEIKDNTNRLYELINNFECYQCPLEDECQSNIDANDGRVTKSFCNILRLRSGN